MSHIILLDFGLICVSIFFIDLEYLVYCCSQRSLASQSSGVRIMTKHQS